MIANDIQKLLVSASLDKIDTDLIFSTKVDETYTSDDLLDKNFIIITGIASLPSQTASNKPIFLNKEVQIQIYYRVNIDIEPATLEKEIVQVMLDNDYYQYDGSGPDYITDSDRYYSTLKFQNNSDKF